jgi:hypothetical protein
MNPANLGRNRPSSRSGCLCRRTQHPRCDPENGDQSRSDHHRGAATEDDIPLNNADISARLDVTRQDPCGRRRNPEGHAVASTITCRRCGTRSPPHVPARKSETADARRYSFCRLTSLRTAAPAQWALVRPLGTTRLEATRYRKPDLVGHLAHPLRLFIATNTGARRPMLHNGRHETACAMEGGLASSAGRVTILISVASGDRSEYRGGLASCSPAA